MVCGTRGDWEAGIEMKAVSVCAGQGSIWAGCHWRDLKRLHLAAALAMRRRRLEREQSPAS